jgi:hypothetical protein
LAIIAHRRVASRRTRDGLATSSGRLAATTSAILAPRSAAAASAWLP